MKKYELLKDDTLVIGSKTLYRIRALKYVSAGIVRGTRGGYVESESNLSQDGECWVHGNACVYDEALVRENARVSGDAHVYGKATVSGNARVFEEARVFDYACVAGAAVVRGWASVSDHASVCGSALICTRARIEGYVLIRGNSFIGGQSIIQGDVEIGGDACVGGIAKISEINSIVWFSNVGSENGTLTVYTSANGGLSVTRGCFSGTDSQFMSAVEETHGLESKIGREYSLLMEFARSRIKLNGK